MILDQSGIKGIQKNFADMEQILTEAGFIRWAWDYNKAIYDMKFVDEESGIDYYLRIRANTVKGILESPNAVVKLEHPVFARHFFPHGLDYEAAIPENLQSTIDQKLEEIKKKLD